MKLSTDCFDSLGIAAFIKPQKREEMYLCTDLKGNLIGWTRSVYENMRLSFLTSLQLQHFNIMLLCPHLLDFYFPKKNTDTLAAGKFKAFDGNLVFFSPDTIEPGFLKYEKQATNFLLLKNATKCNFLPICNLFFRPWSYFETFWIHRI